MSRAPKAPRPRKFIVWQINARPTYRDRCKLRKFVLDRDRWRCRRCGRSGRLAVHHILPLFAGGDNHPNNLISLCRDCHFLAHAKTIDNRKTRMETPTERGRKRQLLKNGLHTRETPRRTAFAGTDSQGSPCPAPGRLPLTATRSVSASKGYRPEPFRFLTQVELAAPIGR